MNTFWSVCKLATRRRASLAGRKPLFTRASDGMPFGCNMQA